MQIENKQLHKLLTSGYPRILNVGKAVNRSNPHKVLKIFLSILSLNIVMEIIIIC
jgi:hypothetical protein